MKNRIAIVGGGLAGSMLALYLARKNFLVEVFERRPDIRTTDSSEGPTVNLALSARGVHALQETAISEKIMRMAIGMRGRILHPISGELTFQRYGKDDSEVIYATSRTELNKVLLSAAESHKNVHINFDMRCAEMNCETGEVKFVNEVTKEVSLVQARTVIGSDGAASAMRNSMIEKGVSQFTQELLEYGYKELSIPPGPNGRHQMEKNALHIWPRTTFMMIAMPNMDGSFTLTLFYPHMGEESFETLKSEENVKEFFAKNFPDAFALMPLLTSEFFTKPIGTMVTVKGLPWHIEERALLLGDAAHAVVPFFGQGMNCAFEDCHHVNRLVQRQMGLGRSPERMDWKELYVEFQKVRKKDTDAIADLAVENFIEMRDLVMQPKFQLKKKVERILEDKYPGLFVPKYTMVTFRRIPYAVARSRGEIQEKILDDLCANISAPEQLDLKRADVLIGRQLDYIE